MASHSLGRAHARDCGDLGLCLALLRCCFLHGLVPCSCGAGLRLSGCDQLLAKLLLPRRSLAPLVIQLLRQCALQCGEGEGSGMAR